MTTKSQYEGIPSLSTVKNLDPSLAKVLRPMRNYMNALIGATMAKLKIKVDLQAGDIDAGFITERILGDSSVITQKVMNDNITRPWVDFFTGGTGDCFQSYNSSIQNPALETDSFMGGGADSDLIVNSCVAFDISGWGAGEACTLKSQIIVLVQAVYQTFFSWTLSAYGNSVYYLKVPNWLNGNPKLALPNALMESRDAKSRYINITGLSAGGGAWFFGQYAGDDTATYGYNSVYYRMVDDSDPDASVKGTVELAYNIVDYPSYNMENSTAISDHHVGHISCPALITPTYTIYPLKIAATILSGPYGSYTALTDYLTDGFLWVLERKK